MQVVVGKNFDEIVNSPDKDVLIEFYAPWCGHCKHLTPVYESVARSLRSSGIHVGKIDATRYNEAARKYGIRGFPTIKLYGFAFVSTHETQGIQSIWQKRLPSLQINTTTTTTTSNNNNNNVSFY